MRIKQFETNNATTVVDRSVVHDNQPASITFCERKNAAIHVWMTASNIDQTLRRKRLR